MNNPVRTAVQRHFEVTRLLSMGGPVRGGAALEVGCGRGVGIQAIVETFGAGSVDAFDLDPRMVTRARRRNGGSGSRVRLWVGDCTSIPVKSASYDAVFDFGIIHHVPQWRDALREIARVLKPGGRFYAEEMLAAFINHPLAVRTLDHPRSDRFNGDEFRAGIEDSGLAVEHYKNWRDVIAWFTAVRR